MNTLLHNPHFKECSPFVTLSKKPLGFIDIGARGGAHPLVKPLAGLTSVLAFEPDQEECRRLSLEVTEKGISWHTFKIEPVALYEREAEVPLFLLSAPTNHSLRPPNLEMTNRYKMDKFRQQGSVLLRTTTLDKVLYDEKYASDLHWGEFLKLDTQGTEYEILLGAERTLHERTVAVCVEVEFCPIYQDQKLFSEIELYLRHKKFAFYGFTQLNFRSRKLLDKRTEMDKERILYTDAIFFKDPLEGDKKKSFSTRELHVIFCCALLLGYFDFALELAMETWASKVEVEDIKKLIKSYSTRRIDAKI